MRAEDVTHSQRQAGLVRRYHTWPCLRQQTVAEHSWHVARIYCVLFGQPRGDVFYYIMHHDSAEVATGDIPFPVKRDNPTLAVEVHHLEDAALANLGVQLPKLTRAEKQRVKFCDLLEMLEFASDELTLGNRFALPIFERVKQALGEPASTLEVSTEESRRIDDYLAHINLGSLPEAAVGERS